MALCGPSEATVVAASWILAVPYMVTHRITLQPVLNHRRCLHIRECVRPCAGDRITAQCSCRSPEIPTPLLPKPGQCILARWASFGTIRFSLSRLIALSRAFGSWAILMIAFSRRDEFQNEVLIGD